MPEGENTVTFKARVLKMGWIFMQLKAKQQAESFCAFLLVEKLQLVPDISSSHPIITILCLTCSA